MFDLLIVDGNNRARAAHSHQDGLVADTFFGDIKQVVVQARCNKVVLVWDHPKSAEYRRNIYPKYKHTRDHDVEAEEATATCVEAGMARGIPFWWDEGYEGDDLIASIIAAMPDKRILIYGSDRDLYRHLCANVVQLNKSLFAADHVYMTPDILVKKYGIRPEQWIDYYTLKGDSGDDIPGVKDIGEKTAIGLIQKFGSLEGVAMNCANLGIQPHRARSLNDALADGTVALMRKLVEPRIYSPLPETLVNDVANWTNPWLSGPNDVDAVNRTL
jgi:DNA polymerase-1